MVNLDTRFQINSPHIAHETIDNEAIIVNLNSGAYYSLRDIGATLWNLLTSEPSTAEIIQHLVHTYEGDPGQIASETQRFLNELLEEDLLQCTDRRSAAADERAFPAPDQSDKPAFISPQLEKFTDMADLLLLDPIHEVDQTAGWPLPKGK